MTYNILSKFTQLKPYDNIFNHNEVSDELEKQIACQQLHLFVTLTWQHKIPYLKRVKFINGLLHQYNQLIFTRKYRAKGRGLQGYAVFEDHASEILRGRPHVHLLVRHQEKLERFTAIDLEDMFRKAAGQVRDEGKRVFNNAGIDIQPVTSNRVIGYCLKQITAKNLHRVKMFDKDGLSDNLYHENP